MERRQLQGRSAAVTENHHTPGNSNAPLPKATRNPKSVAGSEPRCVSLSVPALVEAGYTENVVAQRCSSADRHTLTEGDLVGPDRGRKPAPLKTRNHVSMTVTFDLRVICCRLFYVDVETGCLNGTALAGEIDAMRCPGFPKDLRSSIVNPKLG